MKRTRLAKCFYARGDSSRQLRCAQLHLVGVDAAPLEIDTWVNCDPLTDTDLKGKVLLLDFWAVWCGRCIATFPRKRGVTS